MKRFLHYAAIGLLSLTLATPSMKADDPRRGGNTRREQPSRDNHNRDNNRRHDNGNGRKQSDNKKRPDNNRYDQWQGNAGNHNPQHQSRPVNNGNNGRPAPKPSNDYNHRPSAPVYGGHNPHHQSPAHVTPPPRPYRPAPRPVGRPVPPPAFRPHYHINPLRAILGISFGTAFNVSVGLLQNANHYVDGYGDNRVYLRNINALGMLWPDAILYYAEGNLSTSTFSYSTPYYDNARYNAAYNNLVRSYGPPVATRNINNGWSATWWGYDNCYVTLEFQPMYSATGGLRYYTTLIMGN